MVILIDEHAAGIPEIYFRVRSEDVLKVMKFCVENELWFTYKPWTTLDDELENDVLWHQFYLTKEDYDLYVEKIGAL